MSFVWKPEHRRWCHIPVILEDIWTKARLITWDTSWGKCFIWEVQTRWTVALPTTRALHSTWAFWCFPQLSAQPATDRLSGAPSFAWRLLWVFLWLGNAKCHLLSQHSRAHNSHHNFSDSRWLSKKKCQRQKGWGCCFKSEPSQWWGMLEHFQHILSKKKKKNTSKLGQFDTAEVKSFCCYIPLCIRNTY